MILQPGDPQWVRERIGKLTGSRMKDVLDFTKKGEPGADRKKYLMELVAERMTDAAVDHYVSDDMRFGLEWEAQAIEEYEALSGNIVLPAGWHRHPTIEHFGATPDGFVGDEGTIEVKCPRTTTFLNWKCDGKVPEQHIPQMIVECLVTRRAWCDFVAFDPRIQNPKARIFIRRFTPTPEQFAWIESEAVKFLKEVDDLFWKVVEGAPIGEPQAAAS